MKSEISDVQVYILAAICEKTEEERKRIKNVGKGHTYVFVSEGNESEFHTQHQRLRENHVKPQKVLK
jgi:YHS domain-containing protein